ncbi:DUF3048 domain-containing protein [Nocardia sp. NPDC050799]|uniref:DUF3048 domain-containing protein n=1 Tax=Nocardia sp. NPDC050799 TaxID=3154842 RepID=UPI0033E4ECDB
MPRIGRGRRWLSRCGLRRAGRGWLSRLAAVFSTDKPPVIGPVRSVRETDLTLLDQFGNPTLASSGAAPELVAAVDRSSLQNASADRKACGVLPRLQS